MKVITSVQMYIARSDHATRLEMLALLLRAIEGVSLTMTYSNDDDVELEEHEMVISEDGDSYRIHNKSNQMITQFPMPSMFTWQILEKEERARRQAIDEALKVIQEA